MALVRKLTLKCLGPCVVVLCTAVSLLLSFGGYHSSEGSVSYSNLLQLSQPRIGVNIQDTVPGRDGRGQRNHSVLAVRNSSLGVVANDKRTIVEVREVTKGRNPSHSDSGKTRLRQDVGWRPPLNAGEEGRGVRVEESELSEEQGRRLEEGVRLHGFNELLSSVISLHRSLPPRPNEQQCRSVEYRADLPNTSVVIIFYNEAWSTLLRTVHSVLDRSPPHLKHVILVDDFSDMDHLGQRLEDYVRVLGRVSVVRATSRQGLIRARLLGLTHVTTTTVVFLDSHCECAEGWLEPLLSRIAEDPSHVVVPTIRTIDPKTFEYRQGAPDDLYVGKFTWQLYFRWRPIPRREMARRNSSVDPIRTPTMAGGLFAIDLAYFYKLGTYDPGMKIWGGENLELSFKIWMCGGTLEILPCSNVGHVFRSHTVMHTYRHTIAVNLARLAAVWLDDYILYYRQATVNDSNFKVDPGDVSARRELRRRLQCHSFAWYMKHVLPDDLLPADTMRRRPIFNELYKSCIGRTGDHVLVVSNCTQTDRRWWLTGWILNKTENSIRYIDSCLHYETGELNIHACRGKGDNQAWKYDQDLKQLYHVSSASCVELSKLSELWDHFKLVLSPCNHNNPGQQWLWDTNPPSGPSWRKDEAAGIPVV